MKHGREFLRRLQNAVQRAGRRPPADPSVVQAIDALTSAARELTRATGAATVSLSDPIDIDGVVIDGAAIEFAGLIGSLRGRGVGTINLIAPLEREDIAAFTGFVVGGEPMPRGRSIRVDDDSEMNAAPPVSGSLPRLVAEATDVLRNTVASGIRLDAVAAVAAPLAGAAVADPDAAFLHALEGFAHPEIPERSAAVALVSSVLADRLGVDPDRLALLAMSALLSDVGSLVEPGVDVRDHPVVGAGALIQAAGPGSEVAAAVALEHHRRSDGTGYPRIERPLHPFSLIVGVAEEFGHLVTGGGGRSARLPADAVRVLQASAGRDLDHVVVDAFVEAFGEQPPGSVVRLSGGEVALVTTSTGRALVVFDAAGRRLEVPEPVDLVDRTVVGSVEPDEAGVSVAELTRDA